MKLNTLKKVLSLLLVICMMASFTGCVPGEEDPTEPSTIETTTPTEARTEPIGEADPTSTPTVETQETKMPLENILTDGERGDRTGR